MTTPSDTPRQYKDSEGNPVPLIYLVRHEPEWAANQIRNRDEIEKERDQLRARVAELETLTDRLRRDLNDPPADVQELVIRKLNLVSDDRVAELEKDKAILDGLENVRWRMEITMNEGEPKADSVPSLRSQIEFFLMRYNAAMKGQP